MRFGRVLPRVLAIGALALAIVPSMTDCSSLTEVFVIVDSDLPPDQIDSVTIEVQGPGGRPDRRSARLADTPLPLTLGVQAGDDESGAIIVTATAEKAQTKILTTTVRTHFVKGESRELPIALCASCLSLACREGSRCDQGRCFSAEISQSSLPAFGPVGRLSCTKSNTTGDAGEGEDAQIVDGSPGDTGVDSTPGPDAAKPDITALGCTTSGNGLVAHWKMDENGGSVVNDCSPSNASGTLSGTYQWVAGRIGTSALQFNGGGFADLGTTKLQLPGAFSMAAWVKIDSFSNNGRILSRAGAGTDRGYELNVEGTGVASIQIAKTNTMQEHAEGMVPKNVWIHLAGVFMPGTELRLYLNGAKIATQPTTTTSSTFTPTQPAQLGQRPDGIGKWQGAMDDVRVYSRVLTDQEIADLAAQ